MRNVSFALLVCCLVLGCERSKAPPLTEQQQFPAGAMTAARLSDRSYIEPGKHLDGMEKLNFWTGFSLFRDPWVIAPSSTKDRDGLGPLFNTRSCISCHLAGGRGRVPQTGEHKPSGLVIRLGGLTAGEPVVDSKYGGQIQPHGIAHPHADKTRLPQPEAFLDLQYEWIDGQYADGTSYRLKKPVYTLTRLSHGAIDDGIGLSPRFAPSVYGMGLLDAISDEDLLAQADPEDNNNDGISARYNRVLDVATGTYDVGRFGLKAKQPSLHQQVAAAFRDDIGITNSLFPEESCTKVQPDCHYTSKLGGHKSVEIPDKLLTLVTQFNQWISVPPARKLNDPQVVKGRELFYASGCESCHTDSYTTDPSYPVESLAGQTIWPYTDLALHDMGSELADGIHEYSANGNEWRTPPLWGIGLQKEFRNEQAFLHDGRASTLEEAILWHGGEAEASKQTFIQLNESERQAMIAFLKAI